MHLKYLDWAFDMMTEEMQEEYILLANAKNGPKWNEKLQILFDSYERYLIGIANLLVEREKQKELYYN